MMLFKKEKRTMIPEPLIAANLELMKQYAGGVFVECGVWKGGMMARMMKLAKIVYGYDSFEGLPKPEKIDGVEALKYFIDKDAPAYYDNCKADHYEVYAYLAGKGTNFHLFKGWYSKELFRSAPDDIDVLRIDCDWYASVRCVLENLYKKVIPGGLVIIDDYYAWGGCAIAVNEFIAATGAPIRIREYEGVCYFLKPENK